MNLQVTNLDKEILDKLDESDKDTIRKIKKNETMNLLFKDFRLKKAQELYKPPKWPNRWLSTPSARRMQR